MIPVSKQQLIYDTLRGRIASGEYAPGSRLPNERIFAGELGVGVVTLRAALKKLEEEGRVVRLTSKGTFVAPETAAGKVLLIYWRTGDISWPFHYLIPGIEAELAVRGLTSEVAYLNDLREMGLTAAVDRLSKIQCLGVLAILSSIAPDDIELPMLRMLGKPYCFVRPNLDDLKLGIPAVYVDQTAAWEQGRRYLAGRGFTRIGEIQRQDSVRRDGGSLPPGPLMQEAAPDRESIIRAVDVLIDRGRAQVIYCYSDFYAITVMEYLQKVRKLRVPEDVAVMGYCGYPGRLFLNPPLSTVDTRYFECGQEAVRLLCRSRQWFGSGRPLPQVAVEPRIDSRESTAVPARRSRAVRSVPGEKASCEILSVNTAG